MAAIDRDVRLSQARRRLVQHAIHTGAKTPWDFTTPLEKASLYVHPNLPRIGTTDIKPKIRYPYMNAAIPDRTRDGWTRPMAGRATLKVLNRFKKDLAWI